MWLQETDYENPAASIKLDIKRICKIMKQCIDLFLFWKNVSFLNINICYANK